TRRSRSAGCWTTATAASPTSTSTSTTETGCRRRSTRTRGCSPSRCTSIRRRCGRRRAGRRRPGQVGRRAPRSTSPTSPPSPTTCGYAGSTPWCPGRCAPSSPRADLALTVGGHRAAYLEMMALADDLCDGRISAVGGGGYELVRVVPRSWTHLIAAVLDAPLDPGTPIPEGWSALAARYTVPDRVPETMSDGATPTYTRWETTGADRRVDIDRSLARLDQSILDTRRSVYPLLGLDPDDPRD